MTAVFLIKIASARGSGGNFGGVWVVFGGGLLGQHFGFAALHINVPDFPATDPLTALAVGIVSGLAATGADQVIKQVSK